MACGFGAPVPDTSARRTAGASPPPEGLRAAAGLPRPGKGPSLLSAELLSGLPEPAWG